DGVLEDEDRYCHVGVNVVGSEKSDHLLTGQPLYDSAKVGFHLLAEEAVCFGHLAVSTCLRGDSLGLGEHVVHQRDHDVAAVERKCGLGSVAKIPGLHADELVSESAVQLAAS